MKNQSILVNFGIMFCFQLQHFENYMNFEDERNLEFEMTDQ